MTIYVPGKLTFKKETVAADPYFNNVSLLLHGDGTNGSTTIVDSSPSPKTVTAVGDAQISTAQSKFGGASIAFDGNGDYLAIAHDESFNLVSSLFTIEAFCYANSYSSAFAPIVAKYNTSGGTEWLLYHDSNQLRFGTRVGGTFRFAYVTAPPVGSWFHIAAVYDGTNTRIFLNGAEGTSMSGSAMANGTEPVTIGYYNRLNVAQYWDGYIDDLRITKGVARYTANFTPPTAPLPEVLG